MSGIGYSANTSLEKISEWLTTIIIGLSLTNAGSVIDFIRQAGAMATASITGKIDAVAPQGPGVAILLCFFTLGFLLFYMWIRRYMLLELSKADTNYVLRETQTVDRARSEGRLQSSPMSTRRSPDSANMSVTADQIMPGDDPDDPWKGRFTVDREYGHSITATVEPIRIRPGLFEIELDVSVAKLMLSETSGKGVTFYLHPTFPNHIKEVPIINGHAVLRLVAYGAFVVGALLPDGTRLGIDLAKLPGAPDSFKNR